MKVSIIGSTGYTGFELVKILIKHPHIEISAVTSDSYAGKNFSEIYPQLTNIFDKTIEPNNFEQIASKSDIIFLCLPHAASMDAVKYFFVKGKICIDLSADFRYQDISLYEKTYKINHKYPELLDFTAYGIPELFEKNIKSAKIIGNPGCYPTSIIIPTYPLLKEGLISPEIIADSKSGVSGAGKKPTEKTHFCEVNEDFKPYSILSHRHESEISSILKLADKNSKVIFTPHLLPINRGIESTIYTKSDKSLEQLYDCLKEYYKNKKFVRIYENSIPSIKNVQYTNFIDIALFKRRETLIIVSCIDNLIKGASGQAVQNMNLLLNLKESTALI
ncbi:N-acetyl-gamma-glutamyl-phosphate reductase [Deferribacter desulfuricans SSM1]|uniref:N-acetyl-gamma-glutamyl-phosphate reductase n=1 Tax=Deferribacter desulfuricans (strain DSM 14783 / JCM 11476 / NBRC 101012 / SSM1) TaxID=639282 RepID=D3PAU8_DEFDS|nr:N-acetyl-gamma-glutamyl-phosphate reductase [Deferribacter desulfuricans]BAI79721.1 N-acetyl-gamma-glutamyl-phosphate reductase [Deferribacter desulfuricans SSM1]